MTLFHNIARRTRYTLNVCPEVYRKESTMREEKSYEFNSNTMYDSKTMVLRDIHEVKKSWCVENISLFSLISFRVAPLSALSDQQWKWKWHLTEVSSHDEASSALKKKKLLLLAAWTPDCS